MAVTPDGRLGALSLSVPGGAWHDLTLLRPSGVLGRLEADADEGAMLDRGYGGVRRDHPELPLFLPHRARRDRPLDDEQVADNRLIARYRIVVEHALAQMGRYQALRPVWRSDLPRHHRAVEGGACAGTGPATIHRQAKRDLSAE